MQKITRYRNEINGLRALAVIVVIIFHAEIDFFQVDENFFLFKSGIFGVDIFFVISGYVISRMILNELISNNSFDFIHFYKKRARRLLPSLITVMIVVIIVICFEFPLEDIAQNSIASLSAITFWPNFYFYFLDFSYLDSNNYMMLLHTWSLGVEEQFYLIFPLLLVAIFKWRKNALLLSILTFCLYSLFIAYIISPLDPDGGFYLFPSRFWELLVGALVSIIEFRWGQPKKNIISKASCLASLGIIIYSVAFLNLQGYSHPGIITLLPVLSTATLIYFMANEVFIKKIFSWKPAVYIGKISYAIYLWHFPIFIYFELKLASYDNFEKILCILITIILAALTTHFIEKPIRQVGILKNKNVFRILGGAVLTFIVINIAILIKINPEISRQKQLVFIDKDDKFIWSKLSQSGKDCYDRNENFCLFSGVGKLDFIFIGDSHLGTVANVFYDKKELYRSLTIIISGVCPGSIYPIHRTLNAPKYSPPCNIDRNQKIKKLIDDNPKAVIVIYSAWLRYLLEDNLVKVKLPKYLDNGLNKVITATAISAEKWADNGHKVILFYPQPMPPFRNKFGGFVPNYFKNLAKNNSKRNYWKKFKPEIYGKPFIEYYINTQEIWKQFNMIKNKNLYRVFPHTVVCNTLVKDYCITNDGEKILYLDNSHLTTTASRKVTKLLIDKIHKIQNNIPDQQKIPTPYKK